MPPKAPRRERRTTGSVWAKREHRLLPPPAVNGGMCDGGVKDGAGSAWHEPAGPMSSMPRNSDGWRSGDREVPDRASLSELVPGQGGRVDGPHHDPVPADGTVLVACVPEASGLEESERSPQRLEEMACRSRDPSGPYQDRTDIRRRRVLSSGARDGREADAGEGCRRRGRR